MGWGSEAVPVPIAADRDCGCWKPEKPEVVVTQELSERLSEAVKAEAVWRVTDRYTLPWRPKTTSATKPSWENVGEAYGRGRGSTEPRNLQNLRHIAQADSVTSSQA